ncbi:hypothetical protein CYFUS_007655 [Cystobacter fuscus]|uniref:Uncharacterized protein n=1 Tax=Cystobacter fuscus TaxID=43 RepID=A0A250JF13_9BACT|nr:hypothetical protein CYFUS_007655 [Cystobacter fuscus]
MPPAPTFERVERHPRQGGEERLVVLQTEGEEQQRESAHPAVPAFWGRRVNRDRPRGSSALKIALVRWRRQRSTQCAKNGLARSGMDSKDARGIRGTELSFPLESRRSRSYSGEFFLRNSRLSHHAE